MRKLLITVLLGMATIVYAQCKIQGNEILEVGELATYAVSVEQGAQCEECHQWNIIGNAVMSGDSRKDYINIFADKAGTVQLNAIVLTSKGIEQCSKEINASSSNKSGNENIVKPLVKCNISIDNFKEVKYDDKTVAIFPSSRMNNYKYLWEVYYSNGTKKMSEDKISTFEYTPKNYIQKIEVKIISDRCMKKLTKKYDRMYWKIFNQNK